MHLIELLLPAGEQFAQQRRTVVDELSSRFGGVTAFTRAPAKGCFEQGGKRVEDDIVVIEVMTEQLDTLWWETLRERLEHEFAQDEIVIRSTAILRL